MPSDHMGVAITPATVSDGTLLASLDPVVHPRRALGDGAVETDSPVTGTAADGGTGELEGNAAPKPVDGGETPIPSEGDSATPTEAAEGVDG